MDRGDSRQDDGPKISVRQISIHSGSSKGSWRIGWRVENLARHMLRSNAARFPHGQFKAAGQRFEPALVLGHTERVEFEATIACAEPAGVIVENAFVIFSAVWQDKPWRIFVRLRVIVDGEGKPKGIPKLITTQQVGFSNEMRSNGLIDKR
jgi:hypothetical protein